jgi:hypothetical protein
MVAISFAGELQNLHSTMNFHASPPAANVSLELARATCDADWRVPEHFPSSKHDPFMRPKVTAGHGNTYLAPNLPKRSGVASWSTLVLPDPIMTTDANCLRSSTSQHISYLCSSICLSNDIYSAPFLLFIFQFCKVPFVLNVEPFISQCALPHSSLPSSPWPHGAS